MAASRVHRAALHFAPSSKGRITAFEAVHLGSSPSGASMRINVYSQELTEETQLEEKESNTGIIYTAVRLILHSSPRLHHPPADDDRSGITFWLPRSAERREALAKTFEELARKVRAARPETGLD